MADMQVLDRSAETEQFPEQNIRPIPGGNTENTGKKVFFLYPNSVIQDELLSVLIMAGYEIYTMRDHTRAYQVLAHFNDSIMFINIDRGLEEPQWEVYIKEILNNPKTKNCRLGILSYNSDHKLMEKYLMDIGVQCGYVQLKLGLKPSTQILLNVLEAVEARGRRRCIRANCEDEINSTVNIKKEDRLLNGKLVHISVAGISVRFDKAVSFKDNERLTDFQLRLWGMPITVQATVRGTCQGQANVWIFLFEPGMRDEDKETIYYFVRYCLNRYMEHLEL
ncbi:hypothetical protein AGMMS49546_08660 [Spirochaetia bacterium]|nr:hypothetical protein AGMMS49546_08660 [Spirochaetia bacterium]